MLLALADEVDERVGEESVAQGARIVGAAKVVEEIVAGARSVAFA